MNIQYIINTLISDDVGEDSSWIAEVYPQAYNTLLEAKTALQKIILKEWDTPFKTGLFATDTRTIDVNIDEFDTEVEINRLNEDGTFVRMVARYSIQTIDV